MKNQSAASCVSEQAPPTQFGHNRFLLLWERFFAFFYLFQTLKDETISQLI